MEENIEELINKAKDGNKMAFTQLICEIRHELYKIARCRLSCEDDIEDAVQETIISAFKNIKKLNKNELYKNWIIKILINKCNYIYKKNKDRNISFENHESKNFYYQNDKYDKLEEMDFYSILDGLSYDERLILTLFYLEDYSIKEISKILKKNENTIKTKLKRGKNKIKEKLLKGGN